MRFLFALSVVILNLGAWSVQAEVASIHTRLEGVSLGMSRSDLTEKLDARDITGVPDEASESGARFALLNRERYESQGMQKFEVRRSSNSAVFAIVDSEKKEVIGIQAEYPPAQFVPLVVSYSKMLGDPKSHSGEFSTTAIWQDRGNPPTFLQISLKISSGKPAGSLKMLMDAGKIDAIESVPVFEKTTVFLGRVQRK